MKILYSLVTVGLIVYGLMCSYLYIMQRSLLYFPVPESNHKQANFFSLTNQGETLKIWHLDSTSDSAIIYYGGNGEDVAQNIETYSTLFPNHSVYLLNYRGYGGSTGMPTEEGINSDALALYDEVEKKHEKVSVIGRSLGSGVAVYVASERVPQRLALITPFDSIEALARKNYPIFPVSLLLKDKYDSISMVKNIKSTTLIMIAERDEIIPSGHSHNLINAFDGKLVKQITIPGTTHNTVDNSSLYQMKLAEFLNE